MKGETEKEQKTWLKLKETGLRGGLTEEEAGRLADETCGAFRNLDIVKASARLHNIR